MAKSNLLAAAHTGRLLMLLIVVTAFTIVTMIVVELLGGAAQFRTIVENAGVWAPLLYVLLKASTYVIAPLSGVSVKLAAGALFGTWDGMLLGLAGDTLGGCLNYWIARTFGRAGIRKFAGKQAIQQVDKVANRVGGWRVLLGARVLLSPFYDFISYAAGLARIPFPQYLLVTIFGGVPISLLFAIAGNASVESTSVSRIMLIFFSTVFVAAILAYLYHRRARGNKPPALEEQVGE